MLKLITPLALAAIAVLSIAPKSQAIPINLNSIFIGQDRYGDTRVRAVVQVGAQPEYGNRGDWQRYREIEIQREREAERRRDRGYYRRDRDDDRRDYHRGEY
ncbi:hypothetical protein, partial [Chamaesiphon sp. VAR_69_metabat_338]|uniref:hypothetical protein n=1 Tax=Chamaesiphon sp. VAR_69_metabat_338 TaxID=2964704 RepID=UPI00286E7C82